MLNLTLNADIRFARGRALCTLLLLTASLIPQSAHAQSPNFRWEGGIEARAGQHPLPAMLLGAYASANIVGAGSTSIAVELTGLRQARANAGVACTIAVSCDTRRLSSIGELGLRAVQRLPIGASARQIGVSAAAMWFAGAVTNIPSGSVDTGVSLRLGVHASLGSNQRIRAGVFAGEAFGTLARDAVFLSARLGVLW